MSFSLVSFPSVSVSYLFLSCGTDVLPAYVTKLFSFPAQFGPKDEASQLLKTSTIYLCLPNIKLRISKFCTVSLFLRMELQAIRISVDQYMHGIFYLACSYLKQSANCVSEQIRLAFILLGWVLKFWCIVCGKYII